MMLPTSYSSPWYVFRRRAYVHSNTFQYMCVRAGQGSLGCTRYFDILTNFSPEINSQCSRSNLENHFGAPPVLRGMWRFGRAIAGQLRTGYRAVSGTDDPNHQEHRLRHQVERTLQAIFVSCSRQVRSTLDVSRLSLMILAPTLVRTLFIGGGSTVSNMVEPIYLQTRHDHIDEVLAPRVDRE